MRLVGSEEQQVVLGGKKHYHWFCSKNRYLSAQYKKRDDAIFQSGVHAQKYKHNKYMSIMTCRDSI